MTSARPMGMLNHPQLGPVQYSIKEVSEVPDEQVAQTIDLMREYAWEDASSPIILQEVSTCAVGDPLEDTWAYLSRREGRRSMTFVRDEATGEPCWNVPQFSEIAGRWNPIVETLMRPCDQAVASQAQGDCDDFSMYGAAHLLARGVPVSYCTVAADPSDPTLYSHVYLVAYPRTGIYRGRRVPVDLSHGPYLGWETENRFGKRTEWPVDGCNPLLRLVGVGLLAAGAWGLYKVVTKRGGAN